MSTSDGDARVGRGTVTSARGILPRRPGARTHVRRSSIGLLVALVAVGSRRRAEAARPDPRHPSRCGRLPNMVLGDSLAYEARFAIAARATTRRSGVSTIHAFAFASPCEWRQWLPTDLRTQRPDVVALMTLGNVGSGTCRRATFGSEEYFRLYRADLAALSGRRHARRVFESSSSPRRRSPNADTRGRPASDHPNRGDVGVEQLRASRVFADVRRALSDDGRYVPKKRCLPDEGTAVEGCRNGTILIRTQPPAPDAGIHLCPLGLVAGTKGVCGVYASGEQRLAHAMANRLAPRSSTGER